MTDATVTDLPEIDPALIGPQEGIPSPLHAEFAVDRELPTIDPEMLRIPIHFPMPSRDAGEPLPDLDVAQLTITEDGGDGVDIDRIHANPKLKAPGFACFIKSDGTLTLEYGETQHVLNPAEVRTLVDYLDRVSVHELLDAAEQQGGAS